MRYNNDLYRRRSGEVNARARVRRMPALNTPSRPNSLEGLVFYPHLAPKTKVQLLVYSSVHYHMLCIPINFHVVWVKRAVFPLKRISSHHIINIYNIRFSRANLANNTAPLSQDERFDPPMSTTATIRVNAYRRAVG